MTRLAPRVVAVTSLTAAVALMAVTAVADPSLEAGAQLGQSTRGAGGSLLVAGLATVALAVLLAVGAATLVLIVPGRGRALVVAAAVATVAGAPGFILDASVELALLDLARSHLGDDVVASVAAVLDGGTAETIAFLGILLVWAGMLMLPVGLWRAELVPAPLAALVLLATLVEPPAHQVRAMHIAAHLVLFAGYAGIAHRLWRHQPRVNRPRFDAARPV
jgi:hypothetical protein